MAAQLKTGNCGSYGSGIHTVVCYNRRGKVKEGTTARSTPSEPNAATCKGKSRPASSTTTERPNAVEANRPVPRLPSQSINSCPASTTLKTSFNPSKPGSFQPKASNHAPKAALPLASTKPVHLVLRSNNFQSRFKAVLIAG